MSVANFLIQFNDVLGFPLVIPVVVGSNPISHPKISKATLAVAFASLT